MSEEKERIFEGDARRHFDQILENVEGADASYKRKPEWWYWTQSFKDELDDALRRKLVSKDDFESLKEAVRERVLEDNDYYQGVKSGLIKMIGEDEYEEWLEEDK